MTGPLGDIRIGISGWRYPPWRGIFYPQGLPQRRELAFAAAEFRSVEINGTFYSLQRPAYFESWAADVPDDFVFAVKGSRFITHAKKLLDVEVPLANFFAQGLLRLEARLGPFLWQFPPAFRLQPDRLARFFDLLPRDSAAAARLAARHDARLAGRAWTHTDATRPLRHAIEIRHDSFRDPAFIRLLRDHDVGLVCADTVAWPRLMDVTSDFVYCRLHGSEVLYVSGYEPAALDLWADRVVAWAAGGEPDNGERIAAGSPADRRPRDVYVYFDNDAKVRAPFDARGLIDRVRARVAAHEAARAGQTPRAGSPAGPDG